MILQIIDIIKQQTFIHHKLNHHNQTSMYYRRWTRMFPNQAAKYFNLYGFVHPNYEQMLQFMNHNDPLPASEKKIKTRLSSVTSASLDTKLINNLFKKYPDLKYESINRQKYQGSNLNSYSYAYAFISEQKKLIKEGYTTKKSFEIVEQKFQKKIQRKLDQTLLGRNLAITNQARSLMTVYQQQVEFESRMKMKRTEREVCKYEQKLEAMKRAIENNEIQGEDYYERVFEKITDEIKDPEEERMDMIKRVTSSFENMFNEFYERAAYKDKLNGLSDEAIRKQIISSPQKIKNQSKKLLKYLKLKGSVEINDDGQIEMNDEFSDKMKDFIRTSPIIRIALLNDKIGYESPRHPFNRQSISEVRKNFFDFKNAQVEAFSSEDEKKIKEKKLKEYEKTIYESFPQRKDAYRLLESSEERMLRLQMKHYEYILKQKGDLSQAGAQRMAEIISRFRRLKFRLEKRYEREAFDELAFFQHSRIEDALEIQKQVEYEDLISYLHRKFENRRLKLLDQVQDNKINDMLKPVSRPEYPQKKK